MSSPTQPEDRRLAGLLIDALLLIAAAVVVATVVSWPLPLHLGDATLVSPHHPDLQCAMWWPDAVSGWLFGNDPLFFRPELNWPEGQDVRLLVWNYGAQLLFAPIAALADPLRTVNLMTLGSMVLNGLAAGLGARWLTGSRTAALAATVVGSAGVYALMEGGAGRPEQALWAPVALYLAGLVRLRSDPYRTSTALVAGLALAGAGAVYWFYAYFLVLLTVLAAGVWLTIGPDRRGMLVGLIRTAAVSLVVVLPFLLPIVVGLGDYPAYFADVRENVGDAASRQLHNAIPIGSWFGAWFRDALPLAQRAEDGRHFVPTVALLVTGWALFTARRGRDARRPLLALAALSLAFAAGPMIADQHGSPVHVARHVLRLPGALLDSLPGYDRLWWPYRWLGPASAAAALLAGLWVARSRRRVLVAALLAVVAVGETSFDLRSGLAPGASIAAEVEVAGAMAAIGNLEGERPILIDPGRAHPRPLVGYWGWHHQPMNVRLGPDLASRLAFAGSQPREVSDLERALAAEPGAEPPRATLWTSAETGGFHYVLNASSRSRSQERGAYDRQLGLPFYCDKLVVLWAIPGLGEVPPEYRADFDAGIDPCKAWRASRRAGAG